MPSSGSFDSNGYWSIAGIYRSEVPALQKKVQEFDWRSVKQLGL